MYKPFDAEEENKQETVSGRKRSKKLVELHIDSDDSDEIERKKAEKAKAQAAMAEDDDDDGFDII